jgi:hypothetical protein
MLDTALVVVNSVEPKKTQFHWNGGPRLDGISYIVISIGANKPERLHGLTVTFENA